MLRLVVGGAALILLAGTAPAALAQGECQSLIIQSMAYARAGGFDGCSMVAEFAPNCVKECEQSRTPVLPQARVEQDKSSTAQPSIQQGD